MLTCLEPQQTSGRNKFIQCSSGIPIPFENDIPTTKRKIITISNMKFSVAHIWKRGPLVTLSLRRLFLLGPARCGMGTSSSKQVRLVYPLVFSPKKPHLSLRSPLPKQQHTQGERFRSSSRSLRSGKEAMGSGSCCCMGCNGGDDDSRGGDGGFDPKGFLLAMMIALVLLMICHVRPQPRRNAYAVYRCYWLTIVDGAKLQVFFSSPSHLLAPVTLSSGCKQAEIFSFFLSFFLFDWSI